jgi:putative ABC transport system permease protein
MVKSMVRQEQTDPGFTPGNLATMYVTLPDADFPEAAATIAFYRRLLGRVRSLPGVEGAALTDFLPLGTALRDGNFYVEGMDLPADGATPVHPWSVIEADYLSTMGIPLLAGRDLDAVLDGPDDPRVAIVNATFARTYWPDEDPVGKRFCRGSRPPQDATGWITVIGVAGDVFNNGFGRTVRPAMYFPWAQQPILDNYLVARTSGDPRALFPSLRTAVHEISTDVPCSLLRTMEDALAESNWQVRVSSWVFGIFSGLALLLAAAGIYGVMSYAVSRRTKEFCIRMALGAMPGRVGQLVLREGLILSGIGMLLGLVLTLALAGLLSGLLFEVAPIDPVVYLIALAIMMCVAALASLLPSRRLSRVTLMHVLREE